jgi:hypothetical protein
VAALKWNGWQHSTGIGSSFEPEYAESQAVDLFFSNRTLGFVKQVMLLSDPIGNRQKTIGIGQKQN